MADADNFLREIASIWNKVRPELDDKPGDDAELADDGAKVPADELKKITKWVQNSVTKFGATASVADERDKEGLRPIAQEVVKSFTAAAGTLLSIRRGAGPTLRSELRGVGGELAAALDILGSSVGDSQKVGLSSGKVLDKVKQFERVSAHNRAAVRRRVLRMLAQLRDATRELQEAVKHANDQGEDEDDDFGGFDESLEPEEKVVVEALVALAAELEELMKQASQSCMPAAKGAGGAVPVAILEAAAQGCIAGANALDGLSAHSLGGFDFEEFSTCLLEMRAAISVFSSAEEAVGGAAALGALAESIERVQVAVNAAKAADVDS